MNIISYLKISRLSKNEIEILQYTIIHILIHFITQLWKT